MGTSKPTVLIPEGDPPRHLMITDLERGSGGEALVGQRLRVHYVGVNWTTRLQFDSSWDRYEPYAFTLGAGWAMEGWEKGILGMREGGRRKLVIPPQMGYHDDRAIRLGLGSTDYMVYVIDLISAG